MSSGLSQVSSMLNILSNQATRREGLSSFTILLYFWTFQISLLMLAEYPCWTQAFEYFSFYYLQVLNGLWLILAWTFKNASTCLKNPWECFRFWKKNRFFLKLRIKLLKKSLLLIIWENRRHFKSQSLADRIRMRISPLFTMQVSNIQRYQKWFFVWSTSTKRPAEFKFFRASSTNFILACLRLANISIGLYHCTD